MKTYGNKDKRPPAPTGANAFILSQQITQEIENGGYNSGRLAYSQDDGVLKDHKENIAGKRKDVEPNPIELKKQKSSRSNSRKKSDLLEKIRVGDDSFRSSLQYAIDKFVSVGQGKISFFVSIESHPSREQYRSWLENIGFEEDIVGEKVGFKLGQIVFDELKRSLQEAIRTPALQATKLSQGSDFTMAVEMGPNRKEPSGCVNTCISGNSAGICSEDIRMSDVDFNVVTSSHAIESESIRGLRLQDPISMKSPRGNFGGFVPVDTRSTDYAAVVGCAHLTAPSPSFVLANDFSQFKISSSSPRHPLVATSRTDAPVPIPPFGPNYTTGIVCGPDRGSDDRGAFGSVPRTALQSCPTGADTGIESGDFRVPQWSEGLTLAHDTLRQISEIDDSHEEGAHLPADDEDGDITKIEQDHENSVLTHDMSSILDTSNETQHQDVVDVDIGHDISPIHPRCHGEEGPAGRPGLPQLPVDTDNLMSSSSFPSFAPPKIISFSSATHVLDTSSGSLGSCGSAGSRGSSYLDSFNIHDTTSSRPPRTHDRDLLTSSSSLSSSSLVFPPARRGGGGGGVGGDDGDHARGSFRPPGESASQSRVPIPNPMLCFSPQDVLCHGRLSMSSDLDGRDSLGFPSKGFQSAFSGGILGSSGGGGTDSGGLVRRERDRSWDINASDMEGFKPPSFTRKREQQQPNPRLQVRNTTLRRSVTLPVQPTNSLSFNRPAAGHETPGGRISASQPDFSTPQSSRTLRQSSKRAGFDWAVTQPASSACVKRYVHKLIQRTGMDTHGHDVFSCLDSPDMLPSRAQSVDCIPSMAMLDRDDEIHAAELLRAKSADTILETSFTSTSSRGSRGSGSATYVGGAGEGSMPLTNIEPLRLGEEKSTCRGIKIGVGLGSRPLAGSPHNFSGSPHPFGLSRIGGGFGDPDLAHIQASPMALSGLSTRPLDEPTVSCARAKYSQISQSFSSKSRGSGGGETDSCFSSSVLSSTFSPALQTVDEETVPYGAVDRGSMFIGSRLSSSLGASKRTQSSNDLMGQSTGSLFGCLDNLASNSVDSFMPGGKRDVRPACAAPVVAPIPSSSRRREKSVKFRRLSVSFSKQSKLQALAGRLDEDYVMMQPAGKDNEATSMQTCEHHTDSVRRDSSGRRGSRGSDRASSGSRNSMSPFIGSKTRRPLFVSSRAATAAAVEGSEVDMDCSDLSCAGLSQLMTVNEKNFRGRVIGGTYQACFDGGAPVVAVPSQADKRVVGASTGELGELLLKLYLPKDRSSKIIQLQPGWNCVRASPDGYVVSRYPLDYGSQVCYFLQKHPQAWRDPGSLDEMRVEYGSEAFTMHDSDCDGSSFLSSSVMSHQQQQLQDSRSESFYVAHSFSLSQLQSQSQSRAQELFPSSEPIHGPSVMPSSSQCSVSGRNVNDSMDSTQGIFSSQSRRSVAHWGPGTAAALGSGLRVDVSCGDESGSLMFTQSTQLTQVDTFDALGEGEGEHFTAADVIGTHPCWNDAFLVSCVLEYLFEGTPGGSNSRGSQKGARTHRETHSFQAVSKTWALGSFRLLARHLSNSDGNNAVAEYRRWATFVSRYKWGAFLSSGACKDVFCVQNSVGQLEAVSVMNIDDLYARGMEAMIAQELEISMMCSSLVSLNICPNLVMVHSLFESKYSEPTNLWRNKFPAPPVTLASQSGKANASGKSGKSSSALIPKEKSMQAGVYQFIRMEFCRGGDLEEVVRKAVQLDVGQVRSMLFQMCFSLFCCRDQLCLRHYDLKLLNFFVSSGSAVLSPQKRRICETRRVESPFKCFREESSDIVVVKVGLGTNVYSLPMRLEGLDLVKLADFGTSAIGKGGINDIITVDQFTTLENTPPEFLLLGTGARQAYSADTFCLGLSYLHLLTGNEPYEELLQDVRCPEYLFQRLHSLWEVEPESNPASPYAIIEEVIDSLEAGDGGSINRVLYDTLYRYLVLFGVPQIDADGRLEWENNAVIAAIAESLPPTSESYGGGAQGGARGRRAKAASGRGPAQGKDQSRKQSQEKYAADCSQWSLREGAHPMMQSVRERLAAMGPGAEELLLSMVDFDPTRRCTMKEALMGEVFVALLDPLDESIFSPAKMSKLGSDETVPLSASTSCLFPGMGGGGGGGSFSSFSRSTSVSSTTSAATAITTVAPTPFFFPSSSSAAACASTLVIGRGVSSGRAGSPRNGLETHFMHYYNRSMDELPMV